MSLCEKNSVRDGGLLNMLRKEVVEYAEENDAEYGRCGTCKHYQKTSVFSQRYNGSRYSFAWKEYTENHKGDLTWKTK